MKWVVPVEGLVCMGWQGLPGGDGLGSVSPCGWCMGVTGRGEFSVSLLVLHAGVALAGGFGIGSQVVVRG